MEIEAQTILSSCGSDVIFGEGYRGWWDFLSLDKVGPLFVVGWEDSAHHYWHSRYFDNLEEAQVIYDDYLHNGISEEREED